MHIRDFIRAKSSLAGQIGANCSQDTITMSGRGTKTEEEDLWEIRWVGGTEADREIEEVVTIKSFFKEKSSWVDRSPQKHRRLRRLTKIKRALNQIAIRTYQDNVGLKCELRSCSLSIRCFMANRQGVGWSKLLPIINQTKWIKTSRQIRDRLKWTGVYKDVEQLLWIFQVINKWFNVTFIIDERDHIEESRIIKTIKFWGIYGMILHYLIFH